MEYADAVESFALLDHAPIGQLVLRRDFVVLFWNRCLEVWTGTGREQIVGTCILNRYPHLATPKYASRIEGIFNGGPPSVFSSQLHKYVIPAPLPGGKMRFQYTVVTAIPGNAEGFHALFAIQDVTSLTEAIGNHSLALKQARREMEERRKIEEELVKKTEELQKLNKILNERAIRDGLTGLFNHRQFYKVLHRDFMLADRNDEDLACLLLDLDFFKEVNDAYGHPCGDAILKDISRLIRRSVRKTDVVARYGGEEFAILLPHTNLAGAVKTAETIRHLVEERDFRHGSNMVRITVSIGIATVRAHCPTSPQDLLNKADKALYCAKGEGRNCIATFSEDTPAICGPAINS